MPLFKKIEIDSSSQILIWEITESYKQLLEEVQLNEKSLLRLNGMKSELHQRAFLSVRKLLQEAGYTDFDLHYDASGKPHLFDNKYISITHSHKFSAIIISHQKAGIDIELQREKIIGIANKFVNDNELVQLKTLNFSDFIKKLTVKWGAKEAIFKIKNQAGISFKNHIQVDEFEINDNRTLAWLEFENTKQQFAIFFEEINSKAELSSKQTAQKYILVYAFENRSA